MNSVLPTVIIDLDLTLYSMAEFLRAHPMAPLTWGHALWRWSPEQADRAIDKAWAQSETQIRLRITKFENLARSEGRQILWLTANPLTGVKRASFSADQWTASSYPHSKVDWAKGQNLPNTLAVLGDRASDAQLAQSVGAAYFGYSISHPAQRLVDQAYTERLLELWPSSQTEPRPLPPEVTT